MLSGETANGPYFEQAVTVMARTCCEAEASRNYNALYQSVRNTIIRSRGQLSVGESVASSAVKSALDICAKIIVVMSDTGKMANYVAKFRPGCSVLCVTPSETAARQLSGLSLGMHTIVVDSLDKTEEIMEELNYELIRCGLMHEGESMVVISGRMAGFKEQLRAVKLTNGKYHGRIASSKTYFYERDMIIKYVAE